MSDRRRELTKRYPRAAESSAAGRECLSNVPAVMAPSYFPAPDIYSKDLAPQLAPDGQGRGGTGRNDSPQT
jgi:hypothetical protein